MGRSSQLMEDATQRMLRANEELMGLLRSLGVPATDEPSKTASSKTEPPALKTTSLSQLQPLLPVRGNWEQRSLRNWPVFKLRMQLSPKMGFQT